MFDQVCGVSTAAELANKIVIRHIYFFSQLGFEKRKEKGNILSKLCLCIGCADAKPQISVSEVNKVDQCIPDPDEDFQVLHPSLTLCENLQVSV